MISREELYGLVWSKPMSKVAAQFQVSGSYMARVCTILNVPRPERGYWAKLTVGKAPPREPLPQALPGDQLHWIKDRELPPPPKPRRPPEHRARVKVRIPKNRMHSLVRGAKQQFENSRPVDEGAYLKPRKRLLVDVTASKGCLGKALDFANELFNAFEAVGYRVVIAPSDEPLSRAIIDERKLRNAERNPDVQNAPWSPARPTVVYVGGVAIGLAIIEMSEEVLRRKARGRNSREINFIAPTRARPSGRLRLVVYSPYRSVDWSTDWQETNKASLRSAVKSIVKSVDDAAVDLVAKFEEADRLAEIARQERLAAEENRRREEDQRRVERSVRDSREQLDQIIQQWSDVLTIERFLAAIEQRAAALPATERASVLQRLQLAREYLGTQDPLDFFLSWKTPSERYPPLYTCSGTAPRSATDSAAIDQPAGTDLQKNPAQSN